MPDKRPAGSASTSLDGRGANSGILERAYLLRLAEELLRRSPRTPGDFEVLASRLAKAIRREPYDGYYIRSVIEGRNPITAPLIEAARNLSAELDGKPRAQDYTEVTVRVPPGVLVPEGTIILRDAVTCICGQSFIPTIWNQINHTRACGVMRARRRA